MERTQNLLFITYFLKQSRPEFEVRCCGCREIVIPAYKTPVHIIGMIKSDEKFIPVIDPMIWFRGEPTRLTDSACILVVEHSYEYKQFKTAIIINDIEELMNLVAGSYERHVPKRVSFNVRFVLELYGNSPANDFLTDSHIKLRLCREQKDIEDDFAAFKELVLRGLAYA